MLATTIEVAVAVTERDDVVEELYRRHRGDLTRLARFLVDDPAQAEELVQDVFAAVLAQRRLPADGVGLAYLRRAVVNRSRGELRKRRVRRSARVPVAPEATDAPDQARRYEVLAAVRLLPIRQRECVVLRFYADLGDDAIAAVLGIGAGSVKQHLHRARTTLAAKLEDER